MMVGSMVDRLVDMANMSRLMNVSCMNRLVDRLNIWNDWWCSTSFIGPWVVGEPGRVDQILAAGVMGVHIAPLGSCMIYTPAVALDMTRGVNKGEAGALTTDVGVGRSSLLNRKGGYTGEKEGGKDCLEQHLDTSSKLVTMIEEMALTAFMLVFIGNLNTWESRKIIFADGPVR